MVRSRSLIVIVAIVFPIIVTALVVAQAGASLVTMPLLDFTPTAFAYVPAVFRDYAPPTPTPTNTPTPTPTPTNTPTPTPTPTNTPTPAPEPMRLCLCCFGDMSEICGPCTAADWYYAGETGIFRSDELQVDIAGTTYEFGIAASTEGSSTAFRVELFLEQDQDLLLASTTFATNSSSAQRYVRVVQGVDPSVRINQDTLLVRISHISGDTGVIYSGHATWAAAGGSYVEFPAN